MEICALRRTEKPTSPCSAPQRKAFDLFFCQSHQPFVMDKEKVPCGAPPQSTAHSQSPELYNPIHMLTAEEPKSSNDQSNQQPQLNIQSSNASTDCDRFTTTARIMGKLNKAIVVDHICCFVDILSTSQNVKDTHLNWYPKPPVLVYLQSS